MVEEEIRTYPISLETTANGISVSIPWVQRQANGAVIARLHLSSPKHSAGELLLNESDLIALDGDERPLRTQVRRFWGYQTLADVTPAHLQTARFDVGFRAELAATRGECGIAIAIIRAFRSGEGPKAVGGPWVFKFRVADEEEVAAALRADATQREALQKEAAQREAARLERARAEATRQERFMTPRPERFEPAVPEPREDVYEAPRFVARPDDEDRGPTAGRGRRPPRFVGPNRAGFNRGGPPPERVDISRESTEAAVLGPALEAEVAAGEMAAPSAAAATPAVEPAADIAAEAPEAVVKSRAPARPRTGRAPARRPRRAASDDSAAADGAITAEADGDSV